MSELHEYIEAYFENRLNDTEKKLFEERCVADIPFANEVAIYITEREAVRLKLLEQKREVWQGEKYDAVTKLPPGRITSRWIAYAVAACLLLAVGIYYLNNSENARGSSKRYVSEHFTHLSQTMDASDDSLQRGIAAYNAKNYPAALQIFKQVYQSHPNNTNAKKYTGLVYLVTKDYDKALQQFDEMARRTDLYNNSGLFLKAVTLLQRNNPDDEAEAKQLLKRVADEELPGSEDAKQWLEEW